MSEYEGLEKTAVEGVWFDFITEEYVVFPGEGTSATFYGKDRFKYAIQYAEYCKKIKEI